MIESTIGTTTTNAENTQVENTDAKPDASGSNPPLARTSPIQEASTALRFLIVVAAMTGAVLEVLDSTITATALPQIQGNLGATLSEVGWVNTGYLISTVIVLPMAGWLQNRFGRSRYFAGAIGLFTLASVFCGLSHSLEQLIFWRVVQGLGGGGLLATGQVILLDAFPPAGRGVATALFGVGVTIGPLIGPVAGGWLTDNLSWPWIFFVNVPFGIAAVVMTRLFVPDGAGEGTPEAARQPIDFPGVLLLAVGMGSLQAVLERGEQEDWLSSRLILALIFCAVAGLSGFAWRELTTAHPVLDLRLLRNRSLTAGALFAGVLGFGLYSTIFLLPVFLQNLQGYTPYESGLVQFGPAIFAVFSFMAAGLLSAKQDPRTLLGTGVVLFILCPWGLSFLSPQTGDASLYGPLIARSAALGFLFVPLTIAPLGSLRPSERGAGAGIVNFMRQFGGSVGIAVMSTVLDRQRDYHRAWLVGHVNAGDPTVQNWLHGTQNRLLTHGYGPVQAQEGALALLAQTVEKQVFLLSFNDCFRLVAVVFLLAFPLVLLFKKADGKVDLGSGH